MTNLLFSDFTPKAMPKQPPLADRPGGSDLRRGALKASHRKDLFGGGAFQKELERANDRLGRGQHLAEIREACRKAVEKREDKPAWLTRVEEELADPLLNGAEIPVGEEAAWTDFTGLQGAFAFGDGLAPVASSDGSSGSADPVLGSGGGQSPAGQQGLAGQMTGSPNAGTQPASDVAGQSAPMGGEAARGAFADLVPGAEANPGNGLPGQEETVKNGLPGQAETVKNGLPGQAETAKNGLPGQAETVKVEQGLAGAVAQEIKNTAGLPLPGGEGDAAAAPVKGEFDPLLQAAASEEADSDPEGQELGRANPLPEGEKRDRGDQGDTLRGRMAAEGASEDKTSQQESAKAADRAQARAPAFRWEGPEGERAPWRGEPGESKPANDAPQVEARVWKSTAQATRAEPLLQPGVHVNGPVEQAVAAGADRVQARVEPVDPYGLKVDVVEISGSSEGGAKDDDGDAAEQGLRFASGRTHMTANTAPPAAAGVGPKGESFLSQLMLQAKEAMNKSQNRVQLKIQDEGLGAMDWRLKVEDGKVVVEAVVDSARVQNMIQDQQSTLTARLQELGLEMNGFEVHVGEEGGHSAPFAGQGGDPVAGAGQPRGRWWAAMPHNRPCLRRVPGPATRQDWTSLSRFNFQGDST